MQQKPAPKSTVALAPAETRFPRRSSFPQSSRSNAIRGAKFNPGIRCAVDELGRCGHCVLSLQVRKNQPLDELIDTKVRFVRD